MKNLPLILNQSLPARLIVLLPAPGRAGRFWLSLAAACGLLAGSALPAHAQSTYWWLGQDQVNGFGGYWNYNNNFSSTEQGSPLGSPGLPSFQGYINFGKIYNNSTTIGLINTNNGYGAGFQVYFKSDAPGAYSLYGNPISFYDYGTTDPNIQNEGTTYTPVINLAITNANLNGTYRVLNIDLNTSPAQGPITFNGPISSLADGNSRVINVSGVSNIITFNGIISDGSGSVGGSFMGLSQLGSGTTILTGANTYTGQTTVSAGTVQADNNSALGTGLLALTGGTLSNTVGSTLANNVNLSLASTVGVLSGETLTLSGIITNTGALTKAGGGILTLTNENSYTGNTTVNGGKLRLVAPGSIYASAWNPTAVVTINSGAALEFDNLGYGATYSFGQLDYGSARIVVNGGTLRCVNAAGAYGQRGYNIGTAGGTLDSSVAGQLWTTAYVAGYGPMTISGLLTLGTVGNGEIDKAITGTGGLNMAGSGTWTLTSPTNTFSGATTVGAGTLAIGGAGLLGSGAYAAVITNNSLFKYNSSAAQALSGVISGSGALTQTGSGTLALSGANTYSGGTTNTAGILEVDNNTALGTGLLTLSGGILSNSVSSTLTNNISLTAAGTVGVLSGSTLAFGGVISGGNSLTHNGPGALTLTNENTYTGNTTVNGGKLRLVAPGSIYSAAYNPSATVTLNSGAALEFDNGGYGSTVSFGDLDYGSARIVVNGGTLRSVAAAGNYGVHGCNLGTAGGTLDSSVAGQLWTIAYGSTYGSMTISGLLTLGTVGNGEIDKAITGAGGLNMAGSGTWTLTSPSNTFSGAITVGSGTLAIGGAGLLGSGAYAAVITNNSLFKYNSSAAQALSGVISGSGALTQTGGGTLALSGANTYSGGTTNIAGILEVDNNTALGTGMLTLGGGILSNSVSSTLTNGISLTAAGTVGVLSGSTLALGGVISGGNSLTQNGPGTLTPTNENTYTGNTTVNGGKLRLVAPGSIYSAAYNPTATVTINSGAALEFDNLTYGAAYSFGELDFGSARVVVNGGTLRSVAPSGVYQARGCNIGTAGGTLDSSVAGQVWAIQYQSGFPSMAISGLLTLGSVGNGEIDKSITGTGGLNMTGSGTWVLTGTNTFSGPITISAGKLALSGYGSVSNTPLINVASGAVLDVSGLTNTFTLQPSQILSNSAAATGTLKGNLNSGAGAISVSYVSGTPAFAVTSGTLTLSAGTVFSINNTGSALGVGSYLLISTNTSGLVAGTLPAVSVSAGGLAANTGASLALTGGRLYLVVQNITTTGLATSGSPSTYGQPVTFTATVSPAPATVGETISFYDGATAIGTGTNNASGVATLTTSALAAGPHSLTAVYPGDANNLGSTSSARLQAVNSTTLTITANNANKVYDGTAFAGGNGVTYTGFVNGQTNTVLGGTLIYTGNSQGATAVGAYTITPAGLSNLTGTNYAMRYVAGTLTVSPLVAALAGTRAYDGTVNAVGSILTVTNAANSDVVTLGGTGVLASAYVGTQAITSLGTLALSGGAGTNYTLLGATGAVVITNAYPGTNLLVSSANPSGYLGGVSFTNILPADATGNVVFASTNGPISTNLVSGGLATSLSVTNLPRGTNVITATYSGDTNYLGSAVSLNQIVTNHPPTATVMTVTCTEGLSVMIALSDIATNWRDVDGDPVELTAINLTTTNGVALFPLNLTTNLDGSYVLATNAYIGYVNPTNAGNDQFAYSISDGEGGTNLGYVDIVISTNVITGQATGIIFTGGGPVTVNFAGIIGYSYGVQRSTNLLDWVTLWTTNAPAGGLFNYTDAFGDLGGNAPSSAYYRLSWVP